jgi:hypothetical protein
VVFADQAAEDLPALDPGGDSDGAAGLPRRFLPQALVRTVAVMVTGVPGQDRAEMPFAEDQHMIQAPAAKRARDPLGTGVRTRRPDRRRDRSRRIPGDDIVEGRGELAVLVADQEPEPAGALARSISRLRACWQVQAPAGSAVTPGMCPARVWISSTTSTHRRCSSTVPACRKSQARMPGA